MLRPFKAKKKQFSRGRRGSFFKPFLEVLEDRCLLNSGGLLQGTVLNDQTNMPQQGALVQLLQQNNGNFTPTGQSVTTGTDGRYLFSGLAAGTYQLVETPPSGFFNDSSLIVQSPVESASSINSSTIQVTIPSSVQLSINGSQFKYPNGTQNPSAGSGIAPIEILSFKVDGTQETNIFVGQFIATANGGTSFNTFCIDQTPGHQLTTSSNVYTVQPEPDLTGEGPNPNNNSTNVGEIAYLYNQYGTSTLSSVNAAALQVAIWTLEFNTTTDFTSSGDNFQLLGPNTSFISQSTYNAVVSQAQSYLSAAAGHSGQAIFLAPSGSPTSGGEQGMIAPGSLIFSNLPKASPSITTTPNQSTVALGTSSVTLKDTAMLSGGSSPSGTITFTLYYNGGNTPVDTETVSVSGNGSYTTPTGYTLPTNAAVTGTYQWDASYSGDTNNNATSDNNATNEQVTISPASPQINTTPGGTVVVGSGATLSDSAMLSGGYNPGGTITFYLFAPGVTPNSTDSNNVYSDTVTVTGNGTYSTATGSNPGGYLPTQAGTYQWVAVYSGDNSNSGATGSFGNEPETVSPASPAIATTPNVTTVTLGTSSVTLKDTAVLSGGYSPTGTITFTLYYNGGSTPLDTETASVSGNGSYTTPTGYTLPTNTAVTGTYQWDASYSGDTNNNSVSDNNATNEQVTVSPASPQINTTPGGTVVLGSGAKLSDSATLSGGYNPGGTITFYLFAPGVTPNNTDSNNVYSDTVTVSGNGTYSTTTGTNPGGYVPTQTGTYQWVAVYSGDNNSSGATGNFGNEPETVSPASPSITTTPNVTTVTLGTSSVTLKDTAMLSGGYSPSGTITFTLYYNGGNTPVDTETVSVSGNGSYTTPTGYKLPTNAAVTGTYQWDASYSGDSNNNSVSDNNATNEQVTVSPASPQINTTPGGAVVLGSGATLSDSAKLSGGYNPGGTLTFYLFAPGVTPNSTDSNNVYSDTVTVSGNGTYSTTTGTNPGGYVPTQTGTYQWVAVYSGDSDNNTATGSFGSEPETVSPPPPVPVGHGAAATMGFWHNKNGQAVIDSFNGSTNATNLGNWMASNFPNLFGNFAGQTNTQIAADFLTAFGNVGGVQGNTYAQTFAVALAVYATDPALGGNSTAAHYGFTIKPGGTGSDSFNVGSNGAAFGVPNNTSLSVLQILQILNSNYNPTTHQFYGGSQTLTSAANNVVNGINSTGDITNAVQADPNSAGALVYTPAQVRTAYGINNLALDGTGQTIAIVDAYDDPSIFQELDTFDSQFGLTSSGPTLYQQYGAAASFLTVLNQNGQMTSLPTTDPSGPGSDNWEVEEALDVEWAHALAPGASIILVEANSQSLSDLMASVATAANQPGVSVVSMSWGLPEGQSIFANDEARYDSVFTKPGVTFLASTGDYGAADPEYPAFSPNVVAVGGTSLSVNTDSSYNSETGWGYFSNSMGAFIGSGGGVSMYEPEPSFQLGVQSTGSRTTPDVSFLADPNTGAWIADTYNLSTSNPFEVAGGTSLSAPSWAGLIALVNQGRVATGQGTLNNTSPTQAQQALYSLPQSDFNSITSGTNNGYNATAGYNLVTGLGTPKANQLVPDLIAYSGDGGATGTATGSGTQNSSGITFNAFNALTGSTSSPGYASNVEGPSQAGSFRSLASVAELQTTSPATQPSSASGALASILVSGSSDNLLSSAQPTGEGLTVTATNQFIYAANASLNPQGFPTAPQASGGPSTANSSSVENSPFGSKIFYRFSKASSGSERTKTAPAAAITVTAPLFGQSATTGNGSLEGDWREANPEIRENPVDPRQTSAGGSQVVDVLFASDSCHGSSSDFRYADLAIQDDGMAERDEVRIAKLAMVLALMTGATFPRSGDSRSQRGTAFAKIRKSEVG